MMLTSEFSKVLLILSFAHLITDRKRSCGKVMFSQVSVRPQGVEYLRGRISRG